MLLSTNKYAIHRGVRFIPSLMESAFSTTALSTQLVADIQEYIVQQALAPGARLPERSLAEHFRVSRSPIRAALHHMAERALITRVPEGGYAVGERATPLPLPPEPNHSDEDEAYLKIARDRLENVLPDRISEKELMRRYALTRTQLTAVLRRMTHEGWVERLPGHGWAFLETLTSAAAYEQSYRFRVLMEPGAILQPSFKLDRAQILRCREEQQALVDGAIHSVSPSQIFDANTRLHETIAASSGNMFILDSLRRLNRVRRLIEYRKAVDRDQAHRRCVEHLKLIDLLLADQREAAADFIRLHLREAAREKVPSGE